MRAKSKAKPRSARRQVRTDSEILAELPPLTRSEKRRLIEEGLVQSRAGLGVPHEEVMTWLASLGTKKPLPMPKPRKLSAGRKGI